MAFFGTPLMPSRLPVEKMKNTCLCLSLRETSEDADSLGDASSQPDTVSIASRTSQNTADSDKVTHTRTNIHSFCMQRGVSSSLMTSPLATAGWVGVCMCVFFLCVHEGVSSVHCQILSWNFDLFSALLTRYVWFLSFVYCTCCYLAEVGVNRWHHDLRPLTSWVTLRTDASCKWPGIKKMPLSALWYIFGEILFHNNASH